MTSRYTGGYISPTEIATDSNSANGIYTLSEAGAKTGTGSFPTGRWTPSRSLRFRASDSTYLTRTPSASSNQTTWTWSAWVKRGLFNTPQMLFSAGTVGTNDSNIYFETGDTITIMRRTATTFVTSGVFRDPSAWYHIVVQHDSTQTVSTNRLKLWVNGSQILSFSTATYPTLNETAAYNGTSTHYIGRRSDGYNFEGHMTDVNFIDGQSLGPSYFGSTDPETGVWVPKRYTGAYGTNGFYLPFSNTGSLASLGLDASASKNMVLYSEQLDNANWTRLNLNVTANAVNDPLTSTLTADKLIPTSTSGYHDFYQGIAVKSSTYYTMSFYAKAAGYQYIQMGDSNTVGGGAYFDVGTGTFFGQTVSNNQSLYDQTANIQDAGNGWYRCSITFKTGPSQSGINQFIYIFNNSSGNIYSGDTTSGIYFWGMQVNVGKTPNAYVATTSAAIQNDWTLNNFSISTANGGIANDSKVDVPGIPSTYPGKDVGGVVRGNYATWNPLGKFYSNESYYYGNLGATSTTADYCHAVSTIGIPPNSGRWYWEMYVSGNLSSGNSFGIISDSGLNSLVNNQSGMIGYGYGVGTSSGGSNSYTYALNTLIGTYNQNYNSGDIINIAYDSDNGKLWIGKNGQWMDRVTSSFALTFPANQATIQVTTANQTYYPITTGYTHPTLGAQTFFANFGQHAFSYTPPAGCKSLCATNLPNPAIKRSTDHFDTKFYYGNGIGEVIGTTAKQSSAYQTRAIRLRNSNAAYLKRTPATASNRKTWTFSAWVKQSVDADQKIFVAGAGGDDNNYVNFYWGSAGNIRISAWTYDVFSATIGPRDHTQWQHVILAVDTTKDSAIERVKVYLNGKRITYHGTYTAPAQNADLGVNTVAGHYIGSSNSGTNFLDGYVSEVNFIDGQQLEPSSFGAFDGSNNWAPKAYIGTYGTNGFYLPLSDSTAPVTYSATFNSASAQILTVPSSTGFNLAGVDWTIEAYVMPTGDQSGGSGDTNFLQSQQGYNNWIPDIALGIKNGFWSCSINGAGYASTTAISKNTWHHIALVRSSGVVKLYVNGVATSVSVTTDTRSQNMSFWVGKVDNAPGGGTYLYYFSGLVSNLRIVKGTALYTNTFTPPTLPLGAVTGTQLLTCHISSLADQSSNGLTITNTNNVATTYLTNATPSASVTSNITKDTSGNSNHWIANNVSLTSGNTYDLVLDAPTDWDDGSGNIRGNYPILNSTGTASTIKDGGLTVTGDGSTSYLVGKSNMGATSGKWYAEWVATAYSGGSTASDYEVGVDVFDDFADAGRSANGVTYLGGPNSDSGKLRISGGSPASYGAATYTLNDVIGIALDLDARTVAFYKNNTLQVTVPLPSSSTAMRSYGFGVASAGSYYSGSGRFNFGQIPFTYTPPSGFKAMNSKNLKDVGSYNLPDTFGNFVNTPDLLWIKSLGSAANWAQIDSIRGPDKQIQSSTSNMQSINSSGKGVQGFLPNGFILGTESDAIGGTNVNNLGYISYAWNRGQVPGLDIVSYGGDGGSAGQRNIPHNLGVAPDVIMIKNIAGTTGGAWLVQHKGLGSMPLASASTFNLNGFPCVLLNTTAAKISYSYDSQVNASGYTYIAYLWKEVPGFSKFGTYTANGSADGPFINCGFRPKFVMFKRYDSGSAENWIISDTACNVYNPASNYIIPSLSNTQGTGTNICDILSNGFKPRSTAVNAGSGCTYIYMAFAEAPFKYANAR